MATRGTIALVGKKDLKVYTHWDGYLDGNGLILLKTFNSKRKLKNLLKFGEISALHSKVIPTKKVKDSFNSKTTTSFYHRDRNEPLLLSYQGEEEYNYIFYKGKWYVYFDYFKGKLYSLKLRRENGIYRITYKQTKIENEVYNFILKNK